MAERFRLLFRAEDEMDQTITSLHAAEILFLLMFFLLNLPYMIDHTTLTTPYNGDPIMGEIEFALMCTASALYVVAAIAAIGRFAIIQIGSMSLALCCLSGILVYQCTAIWLAGAVSYEYAVLSFQLTKWLILLFLILANAFYYNSRTPRV